MTTPDIITPTDLIARHSDDLGSVLPSHIKAPVWIRVAQGAVRRDPKLVDAASQSPATLMVALLNAARLGLEPGTEEFYLTPRKVKAGRFSPAAGYAVTVCAPAAAAME